MEAKKNQVKIGQIWNVKLLKKIIKMTTVMLHLKAKNLIGTGTDMIKVKAKVTTGKKYLRQSENKLFCKLSDLNFPCSNIQVT